ncbi:ABC transporter permease, partial [bacterium M00.F.Ca.ET.162.01.1.1]
MTLRADLPEETLAGVLAKAFGNRSFLIGFVITLLVAAIALLSFVWTPHDVTKLVIADKTQAPSPAHWFGT